MGEQRSILLLGYRQELVEVCQRLGIEVTTLIDPWEPIENLPPLKENEDRIFVENLSKDETILCSLARARKLKFDAVCTYDEYFVVNAALLSHALSTPYMDSKIAVAFRDKYYQKSLLRGIVPVTDSWIIDDVKDYKISEDHPYPVVVKPVTGAGTADTQVAHNAKELQEFIDHLGNRHKNHNDPESPRSLVIERFVSGEEWHVDGWISDGEIQLFTVSKYAFPLIGIKDGGIVQSITLHPNTNKELYKKISLFITKSLHALGLSNGVFHLEMFYCSKNDEFIFSECGARVGGGLIYSAFKSMFNIDLYEVLIKLSLGEKVTVPRLEANHCTGWVYLPSVSPDLKSLPDRSVLMNLPGVDHVEYSWNPGQAVPDTKVDTTQRTGMVLVLGESYQEVDTRIKNVLKVFKSYTNVNV
ncbi:ATP-grasp domain-containing protein [Bacillus pfraonensis]|uniref:ATP-grasp domain-containing protein n=1 Tax=Bacillus TaxID=1386 RepID=UPI003012F43D